MEKSSYMEKEHGKKDVMFDILERGVQHCPQAEVLWLMAAKEKWVSGDVQAARSILEEAFLRNPDSEDIWLAAFKVEFESGEIERARIILAKAREHPEASSERVWLKSAILERFAGDTTAQRDILQQGIRKYLLPGNCTSCSDKWKRRWQQGCCQISLLCWSQRVSSFDSHLGRIGSLRRTPHSVPKARAILEKARLTNPKHEELWLHAYRTEIRNGNAQAADSLMARALQECPQSGILWAEYLLCAPRTSRNRDP
eukprot:jgi/Picre1/27377/NNA_000344.t1